MNARLIFISLCFVYNCLFSFSQVFFRPRDDMKAHLIQLIQEERFSIDAAVYMLTDKSIAQELLNAYIRGVKVRLVLDQSGIPVFVHQAVSLNPFCMPIMHHKFFIFGFNSRLHCGLAWTGSFNCTASASRLHDENAIVTDDTHVIAEYKQCFTMLMQRLSAHRYFEFEDESYE